MHLNYNKFLNQQPVMMVLYLMRIMVVVELILSGVDNERFEIIWIKKFHFFLGYGSDNCGRCENNLSATTTGCISNDSTLCTPSSANLVTHPFSAIFNHSSSGSERKYTKTHIKEMYPLVI
ncbi:hypothetical protein ACTA71_009304 [Dictyostelium dimigraforme]